MDDEHQSKRKKLPLLDAFSLDGDCEDGLTDSHRSVFKQLGPTAAPLVAVKPPPPPPPAEVVRAQRTFDRLGAWLPQRIDNEQMGDALESIQAMVLRGEPAWKVRLRVASAAFWVLAHTALELSLRLAGEVVRVATGRSSDRE
jgi:hypothetical protein